MNTNENLRSSVQSMSFHCNHKDQLMLDHAATMNIGTTRLTIAQVRFMAINCNKYTLLPMHGLSFSFSAFENIY